MTAAVDIAAAAGPGIGSGIGAWAGLRFVRWMIEFVAKRLDIRAARMDAREAEIEAKFNARLRHVEQELEQYRDAFTLLLNALAEMDPANPALREVSKILRRAYPPAGSTAVFDDLLDQADAAAPNYRAPRKSR
jgi:hypothetical protein